jgi:LmbE family N-acetylglucosaminyl deacetylase
MRLLAIFAHPDDEAFSCGGTLAKAAAAGHDVHLICATRGEEGEIVHPDIPTSIAKGPPRGELREQELRDACAALGIHPPIFLDHHDSGFPIEVGLNNPDAFMNQDINEVEAQLLPHIAALKPEVIVTFDPHGGYPHIDHITIHRAAIQAFWSAGAVAQPAPQRLFFPMRTVAQVEARNAHSQYPLDAAIYGVSDDSLAAVIEIGDVAEAKKASLAAHRSQMGPRERIDAMAERAPELFESEQFVLGGLRGSFPGGPLDDLFAGL